MKREGIPDLTQFKKIENSVIIRESIRNCLFSSCKILSIVYNCSFYKENIIWLSPHDWRACYSQMQLSILIDRTKFGLPNSIKNLTSRVARSEFSPYASPYRPPGFWRWSDLWYKCVFLILIVWFLFSEFCVDLGGIAKQRWLWGADFFCWGAFSWIKDPKMWKSQLTIG